MLHNRKTKSMKFIHYVIYTLLIIVSLASCESQTSLLSESTIRQNLEAEWKPIPATSNYASSVAGRNVYWQFNSGIIKVFEGSGSTIHTLDSGTYVIDAKLENPTIKIEGFTSRDLDTTYGFNTLWTFIQVDGKVLDLAGNPSNGGLVELEFTKK